MLMVVSYIVLALLGIAGLFGVGAVAVVRRLAGMPALPAGGGGAGAIEGPAGARPARRAPAIRPPAPGSAAWLSGDDLLSYPSRLSELEGQLTRAFREASDQADHLRVRGERVAAKEHRGELAERYGRDAQMLAQRGESMRRVLALVWRTRVILTLRAHVAVTARRRPRLENLPSGDIPTGALAEAAERYDASSDEVRRFVIEIEQRLGDLHLAVPTPPSAADVHPEDREAVAREQEHAVETYRSLQNQMDRLADTLSYLGDRCHTRKVVEGATVTLAGEPGTEGLLDEVNEALASLNDLSDLGDRALADSAMDNIAEDISQLEATGLDLRAAAEAELEINKLLEQFPRA